MTPLDPHAQRLLDGFRAHASPNAEELGQVGAQLGVGGGALPQPSYDPWRTSTAKLALGWGLAAAGVGLAVMLLWPAQPTAPQPEGGGTAIVAVAGPTAAAIAPNPPAQSSVVSPAVGPTPPVVAAVPTVVAADPAVMKSVRSPEAARAKKIRASPGKAVPKRSTLAEELALLRKAKTALRNGRSAESLAVLGTHRRKFPSGELSEERSAMQVEALCKAGKLDAAGKARRVFLRRWPDSPKAGRVRRECDVERAEERAQK